MYLVCSVSIPKNGFVDGSLCCCLIWHNTLFRLHVCVSHEWSSGGNILSYIDPAEPNPTRQMRVSRQVMEALAVAQWQRTEAPQHTESAGETDT